MNVPAYLIMLVPAAIVLQKLVSNTNKIIVLIGLLLLISNLFIGTNSPNWAPFENPTFGAYRSTHTGYIEAINILNTLPLGIRIYEDNDLPLVEIADLQGINVRRDRSYQTIRDVIQDFKTNSVDYTNQRIRSSIVYLKTNEIIDSELFKESVDVVYNNGIHAGLTISTLR
jgi:hypothetical protein